MADEWRCAADRLALETSALLKLLRDKTAHNYSRVSSFKKSLLYLKGKKKAMTLPTPSKKNTPIIIIIIIKNPIRNNKEALRV